MSSILGLLFVVLFALKLIGMITISWLMVFMPLIVGVVWTIFVFIIVMIIDMKL